MTLVEVGEIMAFAPSLVALPGILGAAVAFGLAWVIYAARPRRLQNRALAVSLFLEAATLATGTGLMYLTDDVRAAYAWQLVAFACYFALPPIEVLLVSSLDTPFSRPLRARPVQTFLIVAAVALAAFPLLRPDLFVAAMVPGAYSPWEAAVGTGYLPLTSAVLAVFLLGAFAGALALRRQPRGSAERAKAKAFVGAFLLRASLPAFLVLLLSGYLIVDPVLLLRAFTVIPPIVFVLFTATLAYAILRTQLFDIELKVKWTLRRGTIAASFVAVFFIASEGAQLVFSQRFGPIIGLVASGALVLVLTPLQRAADRIADVAMPRVSDTSAYREGRRREIYRAAIESAMEDGVVTDRERQVLATLADQLGIGAREALELEREAAAGRRPLTT